MQPQYCLLLKDYPNSTFYSSETSTLRPGAKSTSHCFDQWTLQHALHGKLSHRGHLHFMRQAVWAMQSASQV